MKRLDKGFTIVEMLIIIVAIGILAGITTVAYSGIIKRAREAKIDADMSAISRAVVAARNNTGKTVLQIANKYLSGGGGGHAAACINRHPKGTYLADLSKNTDCWRAYNYFLESISEASGMNIRGIVDPWGQPYALETREVPINCSQDMIWVYSVPTDDWSGRYPGKSLVIPRYNKC